MTITDLHNDGMPFVRYLNGDLARTADRHAPAPAAARCRCSARWKGAALDVLTSPDGRIIPGEFFPHLMKDASVDRGFQVRQTSEDRLRILLVGEGAPAAEPVQQRLRASIEKQTGPRLRIDFEWVDEIPLTPSGKRRVTVREIERAQPMQGGVGTGVRTRPFGRTGLSVSERGFGAWAIGGASYGAVPAQQALTALARAEELGCNFVDTAAVYGDSEALLGRFLGGPPRPLDRGQQVLRPAAGHDGAGGRAAAAPAHRSHRLLPAALGGARQGRSALRRTRRR